jgi:hypothetical protein
MDEFAVVGIFNLDFQLALVLRIEKEPEVGIV